MTTRIYDAFAKRLTNTMSSETRATLEAGVATLTLYKSIKGSGFARDVHGPTLSQIGHALQEICEGNPVRVSLLTLIDIMPLWHSEHRVTRSATYAALVQYGTSLTDEAEWGLAKEVSLLVAADAELDSDWDAAAQGWVLAGTGCRMGADWDNSEACYSRALELSVKKGDIFTAFRVQVGQASNKRDRGDLPGAERQLVSIIRTATYLCPEAVIRATGALATVANTAGQYERAIELGRQTLELAKDDQRLRTKALVEIANFLTDYGLPVVAREALQIVVATAPEQYVRNIALLNLFLLAANVGDVEQLDSLREQIRNLVLTPKQQTQFALWNAQGLRHIGSFDLARNALAGALQLAEQYEFFQLSFEVEAEAKRLDEETSIIVSRRVAEPAHKQIQSIPSGVRHAVDAVQSLGRIHVGEVTTRIRTASR